MDIAISTSPAATFMLRKKNVWFSVCDGVWSDPTIWMSNALDRRRITIPQPGDDVYVCHTVDYNNNTTGVAYDFNNTIANLFIAGKLVCANGGNQNLLIITNNLQCSGTVDLSGAPQSMSIRIGGLTNFMNSFVPGINSTIQYNAPYNDQPVVPVTYWNLEIMSGLGSKTLQADLIINNQLGIDGGGVLELSSYNAPIGSLVLGGTLSKNSSIGTVSFTAISMTAPTAKINFTGSPVVNLSGNFTYSNATSCNLGSGTLNVLTNSTWSLVGSGNTPVSTGTNSVVIASDKILTIPNNGVNGGWQNNGSVTGADGTSVLNNTGCYYYGNTNTVMPIGTFNYNNGGSSLIGVKAGVTMTLPYTAFYALNIQGTAALEGNTTVSGTLQVGGTLQLLTYDFTVTGVTSYNGTISKSGTGTVTFGALSSTGAGGGISFTSNPTVNLSGNVNGDVRNGFNFGSGTVNITQNINLGVWIGGNVGPTITWNIVIASGKTLTNTGINVSSGGLITSGTITGADATAILDNRSFLTYNNTTAPMSTGKLYSNQFANNTIIYGASGNQDITTPSDATPGYQNLTLNGSGTKKLLGNVSVKATYILTGPATLSSNGFALTNP